MSKRIAVCLLAGLSIAALPIGASAGEIVGIAGGQPATQPNPPTTQPGQPGANNFKLNPPIGNGPNTRHVTVVPGPTGPAIAPEPPPAPQPPAITAATTQPTISPEANALIDQTASAYRKLKGLELTGTLKFDVDDAGEAVKHSVDFTDAVAGHDQFSHVGKVDGNEDDAAGANSKTQYFYQAESQQYLTSPAASADDDVDDLMDPVPDFLRRADPSLLLALANHPADLMLENVAEASRVADTKLDSQSYPTLKLVGTDKSVQTVLLDPTTHLIRQVQTDLKPAIEAQGQKSDHALVTIDYTTTTPNAAIKPDGFDWTPPAGASEMPNPVGAAAELKGKPAPDFSLTYLDGKPASLSDLKGQVVVLDFWATWCVPCRESMPALEALYQARKSAGVRVLAMDAGEDSDDVKAFVDKTKLDIPVVIDPDSKAVAAFKVEVFPTKIVIGKDGVVTTVLTGVGASSDRKLAKAVDAALAK